MQPATPNCKIEKGDPGLKRKSSQISGRRKLSNFVDSDSELDDSESDDSDFDRNDNISSLQLPVTILNPESTKRTTQISVPNTLEVNSSTAQADIMAGPKLATEDMKPGELLRRVGAFGGPTVGVIVAQGSESRTYILPKDLFCHQSEFFDKAFNGDFKEGRDQILKLPEEKPDTFELICQWIYTGYVVLEPDDSIKDRTTRISHYITENLEFVILANKLLLVQDPSTHIVDMLESLIAESRASVLKEHIETALNFPRGHPLRKLFASTFVRDYLKFYIRDRPGGVFHARLLDLEGFAVDMFTAVELALRSKKAAKNGLFNAEDPLTKERFNW